MTELQRAIQRARTEIDAPWVILEPDLMAAVERAIIALREAEQLATRKALR